MIEKLQRIISEYTVRPDNHHVGTGTGGNLEHYMFVAGKKIVASEEVESIKIIDEELICNPKYVTTSSSKELRDKLDEQIASAIAETNFVSPIKAVKEESVYKIVYNDVDLEKDSLPSRIVIAMKKCTEFAQQLDAGTSTDETCKSLVDYLSSVEIPVALLAIRTQITIERLVSFNLDEDKVFGPFLQKINKRVDNIAA